MSPGARAPEDPSPGARAVSLEELLAAREARAARQWELLAALGLPLVSMTLVWPGARKDSRRLRALMDRAEAELAARLGAAGFRVRARERRDGAAGPWALYAVEAEAAALKRLAVALEEDEPWGRLLDADVVTADDALALPRPLERAELGLGGRPCLVCGAPAASCLAERRHARGLAEAAAAALLDRAFPSRQA
ncbi:MAG: citrate lyase holo-[acyl-carrier protein] synthase [Spirochaetaceae bacterium]|nr:citrate lyase holo-[acyl-carrier protein] synthase [Spirochaetaceae bacterium]